MPPNSFIRVGELGPLSEAGGVGEPRRSRDDLTEVLEMEWTRSFKLEGEIRVSNQVMHSAASLLAVQCRIRDYLFSCFGALDSVRPALQTHSFCCYC